MSNASLATSGQIAFEIDEAVRLVTVVYAGPVQDEQVIGFYEKLFGDRPDLAEYGFLVDSRYSVWIADEATLARVAEVTKPPVAFAGSRRIAMVRRERAEVISAGRGRLMQDAFGKSVVRYFNDLDSARRWLLEVQ